GAPSANCAGDSRNRTVATSLTSAPPWARQCRMPAAERDPSALIPPLAPTPAEDMPVGAALAAHFRARDAAIGVIGLGYVGLPLAQEVGSKGFRVTGFDIDQSKVEMLNAGQSYIRHVPSARLAELAQKGLFSATADFSRLAEMDAILICVPTPLNKYREPDL